MKKFNLNIIFTSSLLIICVLTGGCKVIQKTEQPILQQTEEIQTTPEMTFDQTTVKSSRLTVSEVVANLKGLDIDTFFEESYKQLLLRDPEFITELGLTDMLGVKNDKLTNISDDYIRETQELEVAILNLLKEYDRSELTAEQQLSFDIYNWYLEDLISGHEYMYNDYPVNHIIVGIQNRLIHLFTDIHPVKNKQNADDYIERLSQVDEKIKQLLEGLKLREEAGVILPKFIIKWVLYDLRKIANSDAKSTTFYEVFEEKIDTIDNLSNSDKKIFLNDVEKEINESVIPAFQELINYLEHLEAIANNDEGVWKFPNGEDYYKYILYHHNTTDMNSEEIHKLGLKEVDQIKAEMRSIFDELGYPKDESLYELFNRVSKDSGYFANEEIFKAYQEIIDDAEKRVDIAFDLKPKAKVIVAKSPDGAFYLPPAVDGSRPGIFYSSAEGTQSKFSMPTLAYHEAIPGHHFQIAIAQESNLPSFRKGINFAAFAEGWALYTEQLAWELGFYENDPYGNLGRLQAEIFRAVRLVVDTGIHAEGWTYDKSINYMHENTGFSIMGAQAEISRYIVWPGQATAYKIGMMKILQLRQKAIDQLGEKFDLKEFHNLLLSNGSMPLEILEEVVDNYIATKLNK